MFVTSSCFHSVGACPPLGPSPGGAAPRAGDRGGEAGGGGGRVSVQSAPSLSSRSTSLTFLVCLCCRTFTSPLPRSFHCSSLHLKSLALIFMRHSRFSSPEAVTTVGKSTYKYANITWLIISLFHAFLPKRRKGQKISASGYELIFSLSRAQ